MKKNTTSGKKKIVNDRKNKAKPSRNSLKKDIGSYSSVTTGDISGINGELNIAGKNITVRKSTSGMNTAEIQQLFDSLYQAINSHTYESPVQKTAVETEVKEIRSAVVSGSPKNKKVLENFLFQRLNNIARMAPDVLDVVVKTLTNPALGIGEVVKKIAEKAKKPSNL